MSNKGGRVSPDYLADIAPEYAESTFYTAPKEYLFISDYVYYPQKDLFETGERYQILLPEEKTIDIATMFKNLGFRDTIYDCKPPVTHVIETRA